MVSVRLKAKSPILPTRLMLKLMGKLKMLAANIARKILVNVSCESFVTGFSGAVRAQNREQRRDRYGQRARQQTGGGIGVANTAG